MATLRSLYVTPPSDTPTMGPVTKLERLRDLYNELLKDFPPAEIVKSLLPKQDVTMPMTTMLPGASAAAEGVAQAVNPTRRSLAGQAFGTLADTLEPTSTVGQYQLRTPTIDRIADLHKIGNSLPSTSNWAGSQADEILRAFGGDQEAALKWARMWGATSPNTSVPVNTRESVSALAHSLENPNTAFTLDMARSLPDAKITMAGSKVPNLNNALAGRPLSGDKVEAMAGFMAGHERIPIDVHALYGVGSHADKLDKELPALRQLIASTEGRVSRGAGAVSNTEIYVRYEDALKRALKEIAPNRSTSPTFAEFWEGARAHKGLKQQGGPIDILRKKGLLEMGAMLDPQRLRAALRAQGWTAGAIAAVMSGVASEGTEGGQP